MAALPSQPHTTPEIEAVLQDFSASFWLKGALISAMERDAVDAAHDATVLAELLTKRCDELLGRGRKR